MVEPREGFITLHRKIRQHPYWQDPERLRAWIDCLFMAAWKDHRRMIGTQQVELRRGEFIASERFLMKRWHWSRGKIRRWIEAAREADEIRPTGDTTDGTIYLVVRYDDYQNHRPTDETTGGTTDSTSTGPPTVPAPDRIEVRDNQDEQRKNNTEESARADESTAPADSPPPDAIAEMQKLVDTAADQVDAKTDRARMVGELRMIVSGDDVTAWRDGTGTRVPWPDRPRLLRLALQRWYLDREQYPSPRSALRYVVAQQYDPHQLPKGNAPSPGSEASKYDRKTEPQHYQGHQSNGVQRGPQEFHRLGEDPDEGRVDRDQEDQRRVDDWVRENQEDAQALLDQVNEDAKVEIGTGPGTGVMVRLEFKRRVLELLETGVSS